MFWFGIFIVFVTIAILMMFMKINIHLSFQYRNGHPLFTVKLLVLKKTLYKKSVSIHEIGENLPGQLHDKMTKFPKNLKDMFKAVTKANSLVSIILRKISLHKFTWKTNVGLGEASATGFMIGPIWMVKGMITSVILHKVNCTSPPSLTITPHFLTEVFETEFVCIGSIRIGKAITALIEIRKIMNLNKKEEKNNGRAPDPRINDDDDGKFKRNG